MNGITEKPAYTSEDVRAEYQAVVDYHTSLVGSRFTIAGLYVAGVGFLASAVLSTGTTWEARTVGSALALWLTLCLWILELRSRALYSNLAHRGIDIEHRLWGLTGEHWYDGFFSRQYKEPPKATDEQGNPVPRRPDPDRPRLAWKSKPMSIRLSKIISHSWGLDLLYGGGLAFWTASLVFGLWMTLV